MGSGDGQNIKVGAFVGIALVVLMVTIMVLGGDTTLFKKYHTFYGKFTQVQGIEAGSVVTISGLKVGNVTGIDFNEDGDIIVSFLVEEKLAARITENSMISVKTQGALGDKYLFINTAPGTPLPSGSFVHVENKPGLLESISSKGDDIAAIGNVIREAEKFLTSLNADDRSALLIKNLAIVSEKLGPTLDRFRSILVKMDNGEGSLGALINDPVLHDKLIGLLGESPRNKYLKPLIRATIKSNESAK